MSIKLDFIKPFPAHNLIEFNIIVPVAGPTRVNWSMRGPQTYLTRLMTIFVNIEAMVGKDFEKGLAALKAEAEKA